MDNMKKINGKALYTTKGAAREYGYIGCNFYKGCPHGCTYCYLKRGAPSKQLGGTEARLKKCFKDEADAARTLRTELDKHLELCRQYGIFLSFTTDPMIDETRGLTEVAITEATLRDIPVWILTKDATFINDECEFMAWMAYIRPYYRQRIHFGFTLTGRDDMEPNASSNHDRIEAMRVMHAAGFRTFASIEPVIDWQSSMSVIEASIDCCDHYKIGLRSGVKKDYYEPHGSGINIRHMVFFIVSHNKTVYLKESARKLLKQVSTTRVYDHIMSLTVDQYGKPYRNENKED